MLTETQTVTEQSSADTCFFQCIPTPSLPALPRVAILLSFRSPAQLE